MPASAARAAFVQQEFRSVVWEDAAVRTMYGKVARDTEDAPIVTWFDDVAHAQAIDDERGALLGTHARRFRTTVDAVLDEATIDMSAELTAATLVDDELAADMDVAVTALESVDLEGGRTVLQSWGTV